MSQQRNGDGFESFAKSPGESTQQILARDKIPPAAHYLQPSYEFLGSEDISIDRYLTQEWHQREVEKVWRKVWQVACREEDIPNAGDFIVYDIVDDSIIVSRQENGSLKAYVNACLHRGNALCLGQGHARAFRCPFHGFTWSLAGKLQYIPGEWDFPHVERAKFTLPEVKVGSWGGFVFINLDPAAAPLADYLEVLPGHLDGQELAGRYKAAHVSKVVPCNWKIVQEAFIEGFHVAETHYNKDQDGRVDAIGIAAFTHDTAVQYDIWPGVKHIDRLVLLGGVPSQYVAGRIKDEQSIVDGMLRRLAPENRPRVQPGQTARQVLAEYQRKTLGAMHRVDLSQAPESHVLDQIQYNIFPNFTVWPTVGAPLCYRFRPWGNDPNQALFEVWFLFPRPEHGPAPKVMGERRLAEDQPWASVPELGPYGPVIDQDMPNLFRLQKGLRATRKPGITLANYQEVRIRRFHKVLGEYLAR